MDWWAFLAVGGTVAVVCAAYLLYLYGQVKDLHLELDAIDLRMEGLRQRVKFLEDLLSSGSSGVSLPPGPERH